MTKKKHSEKPGWIKIHRKMLDWEWYDDLNVWKIFMHCLLKANFKDKKWHGKTIKRGSFITSSIKLAKEACLGRQQTRTAIAKLKSTSEITIKTTSKYTEITVNNYDSYQQSNQQSNQRVTSDQPASNQRVTTTKEVKKNKKDNNIIPKGISKKTYGNERVSLIIKEFERRWGYPPTDQYPRKEAWNLVRRIEGFIKSYGKEPHLSNFKNATKLLFDGIWSEDWVENVQGLSTIRRKTPIYLKNKEAKK